MQRPGLAEAESGRRTGRGTHVAARERYGTINAITSSNVSGLEIQRRRFFVVGRTPFPDSVDMIVSSFLLQSEGGVAAAVVELDPLAIRVRTDAEDDDLVAPLGFASNHTCS